MKKLSLSLLMIIAVSLVAVSAFSITGKSFVRFSTAGNFTPGDSGVELNFDGFTFTYKLSSTYDSSVANGDLLALESVYLNNSGVFVPALKATSPGYFGISKIKMGDALTVGADLKWFTLMQTTNIGNTNLSVVDRVQSVTYNSFAVQPVITYALSKDTTITLDWSNGDHGYGAAIPLKFIMGSASYKDGTATNDGSFSAYQVSAPLKFNTKMDKIAIEAYPYFVYASAAFNQKTSAGVTNLNTTNLIQYGAYASLTYTLADAFKVQGKVSFDSISADYNEKTVSTTNDYLRTTMPLGLYAEVIWLPTTTTTFSVGAGYKIPLTSTYVVTDNSGTTNKTTTKAPGLVGYDPIVAISGSTKFANNWTIGINLRTTFNPVDSRTDTENNSAVSTNFNSISSPLVFGTDSQLNWDSTDNAKSIYLQYDADPASIRLSVNGTGMGVFNVACLDLSYKF